MRKIDRKNSRLRSYSLRVRKVQQEKRAQVVVTASRRIARLVGYGSLREIRLSADIIRSTKFSEHEFRASGLMRFFQKRPTLSLKLLRVLEEGAAGQTPSAIALGRAVIGSRSL